MIKIEESLEAIRTALGSVVEKGDITTSSSGVNAIDLLAASHIVTLDTPLTAMIPRVGGGTGRAAQFKTIAGSANGSLFAGAEEGKRGEQIDFGGVESGAYYKLLMKEAIITDEAQNAAEGQRDLISDSMNRILIEAKRDQEKWFIGGRSTTSSDTYAAGGLGTTPTPTATTATTGGTIANATNSIICVALSHLGMDAAKALVPGAFVGGNANTGLRLPYTRTNADGSTTTVKGGAAIKSAAASLATTGSGTSTLTLSVAPVAGAAGYAWFVGTAGAEVFQGVSATGRVTLAALVAGTQPAAGTFASDNSAEDLCYDGLLTRILKSGSGAQVLTLANGAGLTIDGDGSFSELNGLFASFATNLDGYSPNGIMVSPNMQRYMSKKLLAGGSQPVIFLTAPANGDDDVTAGRKVGFVSNPVTGQRIKLIVNPYMIDSTILLTTDRIPSLLPGALDVAGSAPAFFRARRDYRGETWSRRRPATEVSVKVDGALCVRWAPGFGAITNVAMV